MRSQLHRLFLAARKRSRRLPQPQITKANLIQHRQPIEQARNPNKEAQRLFHRKIQHLMDVLALVVHAKNLGLEACSVAVFAGQLHISQKLHLDRHCSIALASLAAPPRNVERKMTRRKRELLGLRLRGEE